MTATRPTTTTAQPDGDAIAAIRTGGRETAQRREWPDDAKERAYQLWAFRCSRDCVKVHDELAKEEDGYDVPIRTLQHWAVSLGWPQRAADQLTAIGPDFRRQALLELVAGQVDAARFVRRVVRGDEGPEPSKVKLAAALAILDRVGLGPVRPDTTGPVDPAPALPLPPCQPSARLP